MKSLLAFGTGSLLLSCAAWAADEGAFNQNTGPFIEANVGTNAYLTAFSINSETFSQHGVHGYGWSAALGYKFTPSFGLEAGFMQNYATFEDEDNSEDDYEGFTNVPYGAMRFMFPIAERASIIAKLGAMHVSVEADNLDDDPLEGSYVVLPYTGLGFSYAVTPDVELIAQYQGAIYGVVNAGLLSGGLAYNF